MADPKKPITWMDDPVAIFKDLVSRARFPWMDAVDAKLPSDKLRSKSKGATFDNYDGYTVDKALHDGGTLVPDDLVDTLKTIVNEPVAIHDAVVVNMDVALAVQKEASAKLAKDVNDTMTKAFGLDVKVDLGLPPTTGVFVPGPGASTFNCNCACNCPAGFSIGATVNAPAPPTHTSYLRMWLYCSDRESIFYRSAGQGLTGKHVERVLTDEFKARGDGMVSEVQYGYDTELDGLQILVTLRTPIINGYDHVARVRKVSSAITRSMTDIKLQGVASLDSVYVDTDLQTFTKNIEDYDKPKPMVILNKKKDIRLSTVKPQRKMLNLKPRSNANAKETRRPPD